MAQRTLRKGMRGDDVKKVQKALGLNADGIFGSETEQAVRSFQSRKNLKVDGIVGPSTWNALFMQGPPTPTKPSTPSSSNSSQSAMNTVVNGPLQMVIGGALLYGLYKVFMKIF